VTRINAAIDSTMEVMEHRICTDVGTYPFNMVPYDKCSAEKQKGPAATASILQYESEPGDAENDPDCLYGIHVLLRVQDSTSAGSALAFRNHRAARMI
jgi:hypothetical protein